MSANPDEDLGLLTLGQTAKLLKVGLRTLRRLIDNGELQAHKIGKRSIRIHVRSIKDFEDCTRIVPRLPKPRSGNGLRARSSDSWLP